MYNKEDSINTAYDFIQARVKKGYKYKSTPVYNVTKSDLQELMKLTDKYGIPFEWMVNLINNESAGTFNPAITNSIGATGLIQFLKSTATSLGTTTDDLKKMTFKEQLVYVDKFLYANLKKHLIDGKVPNTFTQGDLFMTIFYPVAVGKPEYVFPDKVSRNNSGIKKPKDYTERALASAIFPLSAFPYTLAEVKKKFGAVFNESTKFAKSNFIPIVVVLIGLAGLGFFVYKKLNK
jgi:hypothetical protein